MTGRVSAYIQVDGETLVWESAVHSPLPRETAHYPDKRWLICSLNCRDLN